MVDIGAFSDEPLGQLVVELVCQEDVHQDRHAVLVFFIDVRRVLQHQLVQTIVVAILGSKHHRCETLTVFNQQVFLWFDLLADKRKNILLLVANGQENWGSVFLSISSIVEDFGTAVEQKVDAIVVLIQNGQVKRTERVVIQHIKVSVVLHEELQLSKVTSLGSDVGRCVAVLVLAVELVPGQHQHLQDVITVFELCSQVQCIIAFLVGVENVDAVLGEDAHDVTVAAPGCDPERVQSRLVLLVDIDHFVFQHQSHEFLTKQERVNMC